MSQHVEINGIKHMVNQEVFNLLVNISSERDKLRDFKENVDKTMSHKRFTDEVRLHNIRFELSKI